MHQEVKLLNTSDLLVEKKLIRLQILTKYSISLNSFSRQRTTQQQKYANISNNPVIYYIIIQLLCLKTCNKYNWGSGGVKPPPEEGLFACSI